MALPFVELVNSRRWQVIQDYFAEVIGASIRVVDPLGVPLTGLSNPHSYCCEVISSSSRAFGRCKKCLLFSSDTDAPRDLPGKQEPFLDMLSGIHYDTCPFMINRVIIPVRVARAGGVYGYIVIGPLILGKRRTYPEYFNLSKDAGLDMNGVIECIERIRVYSFYTIRIFSSLFQEVAACLLELAAQKAIVPEPEIAADHRPTGTVPGYVTNLMRALFETAGSGVNAERGSIMLFDEQSKTLSIRFSRGLSDRVVRETKLRIGEGLAGLAAQENRVLFIDDACIEPSLKARMHVPGLKASLIVPIRDKNRIFGVLSLSTRDKKHKFSKENVKSIGHLVKMVDRALGSLDAAEGNNK